MTDAPHICLVNLSQRWGGGEKWHVEAARFLSTQGYRVSMLVHPAADWLDRLAGSEVGVKKMAHSGLSFLNPFQLGKLRRFLRQQKVRLVLLNGSNELKTAGLAAHLTGGIKVVYRRGLAHPPKGTRLNRWLFTKVVDTFLVNSRMTAQQLLHNLNLDPAELDIQLLYNGLEIPEPVPHAIRMDAPMVLGMAARMVPQKGHDLLLEAARILKKNHLSFLLHLAGDGPLRPELEAKVLELGLSKEVVFHGFVHEMGPFLQELDVYVCSSRFEGFGFSMVEAMLNEKPVVAFDASSNPEVVQHRLTGLLAPAFDARAFAEAIARYMRNPQLIAEHGQEGRAFAIRNFAQERQQAIFKTLIESWLLARGT
ncbi:MAG: glycosyltransferase [Bacteroidota bacterium]